MKLSVLLFVSLVVVFASAKHHKAMPQLSSHEKAHAHHIKSHHKNVHHLEEAFTFGDILNVLQHAGSHPLLELVGNARDYQRNMVATGLVIQAVLNSLKANWKGYYDYAAPAAVYSPADCAARAVGNSAEGIQAMLDAYNPFTSSGWVRHPKGHIPKEWRTKEVVAGLTQCVQGHLLHAIIHDAIEMNSACGAYQSILNLHDATLPDLISAFEFNRATLENPHYAHHIIQWVRIHDVENPENWAGTMDARGGETHQFVQTDFGTALELAGIPLNRNPFLTPEGMLTDPSGNIVLSPAVLDKWGTAMIRPSQRATRGFMPFYELLDVLEKSIRDRDTKAILPGVAGTDYEKVVKAVRRACLAGKLLALRVNTHDPAKTYQDLFAAGQNNCLSPNVFKTFTPQIALDGSTDR